jgi:hypothetical protein
VTTMTSVCGGGGGDEACFTSWVEKIMGMWDHLVLVIRPSIAM